MWKYVLKRILLMLVTFFIICTICFVLIRILPRELPTDKVKQQQAVSVDDFFLNLKAFNY